MPKGCNNDLNTGLADFGPLKPIAAAAGLGFDIQDRSIGNEGVIIPRVKDHEPRGSGQYGMALRWLGDGAYYVNDHSRRPTFSQQSATGVTDFIQNNPGFAALPPDLQFALGLATGAGNTHQCICPLCANSFAMFPAKKPAHGVAVVIGASLLAKISGISPIRQQAGSYSVSPLQKPETPLTR